MKPFALRYQIPNASWELEIHPDAQDVLEKHVQRHEWSKESVGQLFTRDLTTSTVRIELATVLPPTRAAFARVQFDPRKAAVERAVMFVQGLHCVGLWHSHPEPRPHPSGEDLGLAKDHAQAAKPNLTGLVFAIVGTLPFPAGLAVWVHDGEKLWEALPTRVLPPENFEG
jgi:proteasome lid subunit RPN8/RPN11